MEATVCYASAMYKLELKQEGNEGITITRIYYLSTRRKTEGASVRVCEKYI